MQKSSFLKFLKNSSIKNASKSSLFPQFAQLSREANLPTVSTPANAILIHHIKQPTKERVKTNNHLSSYGVDEWHPSEANQPQEIIIWRKINAQNSFSIVWAAETTRKNLKLLSSSTDCLMLQGRALWGWRCSLSQFQLCRLRFSERKRQTFAIWQLKK